MDIDFGFEPEVPEEDHHHHEHEEAPILLLEDPETGEEMEIALIDEIEDETGQVWWVCMELIYNPEIEDYEYGPLLFLRVDRDLGGEYEVSMAEGPEVAHLEKLWRSMVDEEEEIHRHDLEDFAGDEE